MSIKKIEAVLDHLNEASEDILLSMVITTDGLVVTHRGNVNEPDLFGAYFLELDLVCGKILRELKHEEVEEIFLRSKSGCVTVMPVFKKGYIACISTPQMNSSKLQILCWSAIKKINNCL